MRAILRIKEKTSWNPESMFICVGENFDTPVASLRISHMGYNKIDDGRVHEIVMSMLSAFDEQEFEMPGEVSDYVGAKAPGWMAPVSGEKVRVPRGGGQSGEVTIPAGAKYLPNGEIDVPARSLDSSSPTAKQFRRACRKARNAIRELAASSGKTVELIMLEIRESAK